MHHARCERFARIHYVLIDYICRIPGGELRAGDDVCAVDWLRRRDLPKLQMTEGTLAAIEKAFGNGEFEAPRQLVDRRIFSFSSPRFTASRR